MSKTPAKTLAAKWEKLWADAVAAGDDAALNPPPISALSVLNDWDAWAWANVKPANSSFARWLVKNGYAQASGSEKYDYTPGGVNIPVNDPGRSFDKNEIASRAIAKYLRDAGIKARAANAVDWSDEALKAHGVRNLFPK